MTILNRKARRELLLDLSVVQHRVIEALPHLVAGDVSDRYAETYLRSCVDNLTEVAAAIDSRHGRSYMADAFKESRRIVVAQMDSAANTPKGGNE